VSLIIDASVAVKALFPEDHTDAAIRVCGTAGRLLAPELILAEFGNVLWTKHRRGVVTKSEISQLTADFIAFQLTLLPMAELLEMAIDIATAHDRTVYDSLYLAAAARYDAQLVTADRKFHDAIKRGALANHIVWIADAA
jgi:predicted nucleic acid-binding protein